MGGKSHFAMKTGKLSREHLLKERKMAGSREDNKVHNFLRRVCLVLRIPLLTCHIIHQFYLQLQLEQHWTLCLIGGLGFAVCFVCLLSLWREGISAAVSSEDSLASVESNEDEDLFNDEKDACLKSLHEKNQELKQRLDESKRKNKELEKRIPRRRGAHENQGLQQSNQLQDCLHLEINELKKKNQTLQCRANRNYTMYEKSEGLRIAAEKELKSVKRDHHNLSKEHANTKKELKQSTKNNNKTQDLIKKAQVATLVGRMIVDGCGFDHKVLDFYDLVKRRSLVGSGSNVNLVETGFFELDNEGNRGVLNRVRDILRSIKDPRNELCHPILRDEDLEMHLNQYIQDLQAKYEGHDQHLVAFITFIRKNKGQLQNYRDRSNN